MYGCLEAVFQLLMNNSCYIPSSIVSSSASFPFRHSGPFIGAAKFKRCLMYWRSFPWDSSISYCCAGVLLVNPWGFTFWRGSAVIFSFTRRLPTRKLVQKLLCLAHVVPGGPEGAHPGLVHDCRAVSFIRAPESWKYFLSGCLLMIRSWLKGTQVFLPILSK